MLANHAAEAYRNNQLELSISSAQPVELVVMLYDGAIESVRRAIHLIQMGEVQAKGRHIARATNIVSELTAVLDMSQGEVAANLAGLYDYMRAQLLEANLHSSVARLEEVAGLLASLRQSWWELAERQRSRARPAAAAAGALVARVG